MSTIESDDEAVKRSIAYVQEFLKENGTTWQDKLNYEKNKARDEGLIETAKNMLKDNMNIKEISKYTGLSKAEIEALKENF